MQFYIRAIVEAHFVREKDGQSKPHHCHFEIEASPNLKAEAYYTAPREPTAIGAANLMACYIQGIGAAAAYGHQKGWATIERYVEEAVKNLSRLAQEPTRPQPIATAPGQQLYYFGVEVECHYEHQEPEQRSKVTECRFSLNVSANQDAKAFIIDAAQPTEAGIRAIIGTLLQAIQETAYYAEKNGWMRRTQSYQGVITELQRTADHLSRNAAILKPGTFSGGRKTFRSTDVDLPGLLRDRNTGGRYDDIIEMAEKKWFHDFKQPESVEQPPKIMLMAVLHTFPELDDIRQMVLNGDFDERPDEDDRRRLAEELGMNPGRLAKR